MPGQKPNQRPTVSSTTLRIGLERAAAQDAAGDGPPAIELSADVEIRQNRYRGWQPVAGTWDPRAAPFNTHHTMQVRPNGTAFGMQPACGAFPGQDAVTGFEGKRLVNSKNRNLGTLIGELQSDVFVIAGAGIDFLIGGGDFADVTCLNLYVAGDGGWQRVRTATGERNLELVRRGWDVAEFRGRRAYLQILDYAAVEPWGWHAAPRYPEDDWGFILVDDIRQTDGAAAPRRVDEAGDRARNFDFESVLPERFTVSALPAADGAGGVFEIYDRAAGRTAGTLHCTAAVSRYADEPGADDGSGSSGAPCAPPATGAALVASEFPVGNRGIASPRAGADRGRAEQWRVAFTWRYHGDTLAGVKLRITSRLPIAAADATYTLHPGLLYDGNPTAEACHYLSEDFPEAAATVPAGFSVEDAAWVFAGWVEPQPNAAEPAASVRLQVDPGSGRYEAVHQIPESAVFGRRLLLDSDERLTLEDGARYRKTLALYAAPRRPAAVFRPGYCGALSAAWRRLYPASPTNPPHTLRADYELRLRTTLSDHGLIQEIERGGRTYRVFYVGRWVFGDAPTGGGRFLPKEYFHRFVGFSWSGMAGLVAHAALDHGLRHDDGDAVRVAVDTMDFFAEHGISPLGILYPTYHEDHDGMVDTFGTYYDPGRIDMGPLGEGLYWYVRCAERLRAHGQTPPASWISALRGSLDRLMELFPDGDVPGRIDGTSAAPAARRIQLLYWERSRWTERQSRAADIQFAKPSERGATNFVYLIWAYVRAAAFLGERRYLNYAVAMGELAMQVMERFGVFAGSEMDFYNIDKRQGHALLAAHNTLHAATGEARWLAAARVAASWFASWQYHFNACTDGLQHLPLGRWDYRTVGGTTVDIKYSTNNLVYAQGATELMELWRHTGEAEWFERARALLHQGVQSSLTEDKRRWLNAHYQSEARVPAQHAFNPDTRFDPACLGGGTEDVLPAWPYRGNWTTKYGAILSMYMLAEALDADPILNRYGGITYRLGASPEQDWAGALETVDQVRGWRNGATVTVEARNMLPHPARYTAQVLSPAGGPVASSACDFLPGARARIVIRLPAEPRGPTGTVAR
ncbi:MAG: hypothetical protein OXC12_00330 [Spirochaetaceae bacterium]|nr:hypothetical protein [Spirochaetaceae bacterium]